MSTDRPAADAAGHEDRPPGSHAFAPVTSAILTIWLAPRWTARRYQHTPLWQAWLDHVLAGLLAFIVGFVGLAIFEALRFGEPMGLSIFGGVMAKLADNSVGLWENVLSTRQGLLVLAIWLAWIEALFAFAGFAVVVWSAQDEPLRRTFRHALRTAWLWTGTLIPSLVVLLAGATGLDLYRLAWKKTDLLLAS